MSYTANCLVVHRTAPNQENLVGAGGHVGSRPTRHRLRLLEARSRPCSVGALTCSFATDGVVVDVARILGAESIPERWTHVSESDATQGMKPIDADRVAVITAPTVPAPIEMLIGQPIVMGRNPVRYVTITINGTAAAIAAADVVEEDQDRYSIYVDAAFDILAEIARTGDKITYGSLGERIAETTGIEETRPLNWWIGDVLERLSRRNQENGEPLMSSMVVRTATGQVGPGYLVMIGNLLGEQPDDAEEHAALQRVRCHRFFTEPTTV